MKKNILLGIGILLFLSIVVGFVTDRLNPSLITTNFFEFIEQYFNQWSPALSSAGTFIAAMIAFAAIFENRRNQKAVAREKYYSKIEDWIKIAIDLLFKMKAALSMHLLLTKEGNKLKDEESALDLDKKIKLLKQSVLLSENSVLILKKGLDDIKEL